MFKDDDRVYARHVIMKPKSYFQKRRKRNEGSGFILQSQERGEHHAFAE
jgi:hypothetical protein